MNPSATTRDAKRPSLATLSDFSRSPLRSGQALTHSLPPLPARFRFTPEFQLLAACSVIAPGSTDQSHTEAILSRCAKVVDWNAFLLLVDRHSVPGPVYSALCRHGVGHWPDGIREKLKRKKIQSCGRALVYAAELVRLIQAFAAEGIEVLSLKGAALSVHLFGDPGMRHVRDLDLMVQPEDLTHSDQLLNASGYQCIFPDFAPTQKMENRILLQDHHRTYWHDGLQVMVELHWRIEHWTSENVAELWQHCHGTDWMGTTIRQLDDDALLLLLCSHGAGHKWSHLKWLSDVALLMTQERSASWDALLEMASRFDLLRALAQATLLVHWLYGTWSRTPVLTLSCLAEPLCELIEQERTSSDLASQALRVMLMDNRNLLASESLGQLKYLRYTLRLRTRMPVAVYMRQVLISSSYFKDFSAPDWLFWLHYPLRPLIWIKRHYIHSWSR